jgi:hypothetical protein
VSKTAFLSSTGADLRAYREAAFLATQKRRSRLRSRPRERCSRYATLREPRRLGLSAGTNRISIRLPSTSAMRRNIARECPS